MGDVKDQTIVKIVHGSGRKLIKLKIQKQSEEVKIIINRRNIFKQKDEINQ